MDKKLICKWCGKSFIGYPNKKYCSKSCSRSANNKLSEEKIVCKNCNKHFFSRHHDQKFCSLDCWNTYKTEQKTIEKTCKKCGKKFRVKKNRDKRYNVTFCSMDCYGKKKSSSYEYEIIDRLKNNFGINNIIHGYKPSFLFGKEIDIFLPDYNFGIEFNGLFWHSELGGGKHKQYHFNKSKLCFENGIKLIHIFEDDFISKKELIFSRIKFILKLNKSETVYARKCEIRNVKSHEAKLFLQENHIQGHVNSSIKLGLFYKDNLVSLMTFGKNRTVLGSKNKSGEYELLRFCSNKNVPGSFSKLLNYFILKYNPDKIISYLNLGWNFNVNNNVYTKCGFSFSGISQPNYWYTKNYIDKEHRFKYRKSELVKSGFDKNMTEKQIMEERGFDRIYDCGSARFEINLLTSHENMLY